MPSAPELAFTRRSLLQGSLAALALGGSAGALAGCGSSDSSSGGGGKTVSIGSNYSDAGVKSAFAAVVADFNKSSGLSAKVNTVDHNTFQNKIQTYLQGTPDDVFSWFAGYRMKFFAAQGLASPIDDVWDKIGDSFPDSIKNAAKADDGHYYFVPLYNYPWVMNYRQSVFDEHGYSVPATWDDLMALCQKMKSDGLTPISFADKDGWPAMGTFDILNMRINGYQFHVDLMAHDESWTDPKVVKVFDTWKELFPYYSSGPNGLTWEEGAQDLQNKKAGMMFQGAGQVGQQFSKENLADLQFFPFPEIDSAYPIDSGIDAPIDGFMMSKKPKNKAGATKFLEYLGTAKAEAAYLASDPTDVGTASDYDQSSYNQLQKDSADIISKTKNIAQFLDRDTRPDFAYPVVQNALQQFINDKDSAAAAKSLEDQAKTIFV
ncbi:multiple sugar transport system substrate-binding protein [Nocardioides terrae]|uniref:Multiple sugar transport system substrate-binding protein n=1 Tax=Nocardioides terrae TaxID=574651 RepID=A0A1I1EYR8_9ACTN|nr:ABC transporter substrate-binding protein [Nocardioides terrae]SFB92214.1 multiple sugar transport system substrate-binding protein [Nocardioides terrae]